MKKRTIFAVILLILLSSITIKDVITISKFNLKKINIENNFLIEEKELRKLLDPIYNKNLIFLNNLEIEQLLMNNNFIKSFYIKKKYPDTLEIKIIEKKPIAILFFDKKNFILAKTLN